MSHSSCHNRFIERHVWWAVGSLVVRASDSRPEGLGSMPDATKHPPSTHGANDRRTSCPCHDEFRGPRSDYVRQVASENNNNNKDTFGDRLISRFGPVNGPPRSCDLTPLDFSVGLC
ncbi:hypothetical protein TNCV_2623661 [Trichonephila clavipes]|nr:hypothetical protein TNCV_2623661 [Trichonephila clavipes]